jgi:hypothetical protein
MKLDITQFIFKIYAFIIGIAVGTILGVIVFGAAIRIILDLLFGWGDSGPGWINYIIAIFTAISVLISSYISLRYFRKFTND